MTALTPFQRRDYVRNIFETSSRRQLDDLTREIWRRYGQGKVAELNAEALANLKARSLERWGMLDRSDPR